MLFATKVATWKGRDPGGIMGKTIEELQKQHDETLVKIVNGRNHIMELFTAGVKVKNPLKEGEEVTFANNDDANKFFDELKKTGEYPLNEISRPGNEHNHMKLFLFSKGFTPADIYELMMNPESEKSKELEKKIEGVRQEYFDQFIDKDIEKIGKMYANAFKNLKDQKMDWLRQADTPEKLLDNLPMLEAFSGSQSFYLQTNKLGTELRDIDRQVVASIKEQADIQQIDFMKTLDALQYCDLTFQYADNVFSPGKIQEFSSRAQLCVLSQQNATLPEGATLNEMGNSSEFSREEQFRETVNVAGQLMNDYVGPIKDEQTDEIVFEATDFFNNADAYLQGEEGALPPFHIFEKAKQEKVEGRYDWGIRADDGQAPEPYVSDSKGWKRAMENGFKQGELMDSMSVVHCVSLAKKGAYDKLAGKKGDGEKMLSVINGNYALYDKLSNLSKAAVAGALAMKHPELFVGSVQEMQKAAKRLGMDLSNPVYTSAMERVGNICGSETAKKHASLQESLAAAKVENDLLNANAAPESKKNLAKTLFLMQLGHAELAGSPDRIADPYTMLGKLGAGEVNFTLPKMNKNEKSSLKRSVPEGASKLSEDIRQNVKYGDDNVMNVRLDGSAGHARRQGALEVDLRGVDPKALKNILDGMDKKMANMNSDQLDEMIGKLKGGSLKKTEVADMIRSFGKDQMGNDGPDSHDLGLAAKEVVPPQVLSQEDFIAVDRAYSMEITGERKYKAPDPLSTVEFQNELENDKIPQHKEYFTKFLQYYTEQARCMKMYADAAERMHRVRIENENSSEPLNNVRIFAQEKEMEMAEKYRAAREIVERMTKGIESYGKDQDTKDRDALWVANYVEKADLAKKVISEAGIKGPSQDDLEANLAGNFETIDIEASTFREQERLSNHKWKLMGVKYSNSDKYKDILDSMEKLKNMRTEDATAQNMETYKKEYALLQDLCEDYIVSRQNPRTQDGKDRLKMVTDIWEGMSNVNAANFDRAMQSAQEGQKLGDLNVHSGERKKVSLQELEQKEPERRRRLDAHKAEKAAAKRAEHEAAKEARKKGGPANAG